MKNRRSIINYSIKKEMQYRLLLKVMFIAFIATGLAGAFFYFYSNQEVGQSFRQFHITARSFLDFLLPAVIIALLIGIVASFGIAIFFPHSIAGPLHRIERNIRERVGEGDLSVRFSVRKGDEVKELADALNIMVEKLRLKIGKVKSVSEEMSIHVPNINKNDEAFKRLSELTKKLEEAVKEIRL
ncbi:MAG: methyl-accepting chemotaxis protein [Deltaproteobacteria bacterium]|nr:methyl-accepting chemotaxis protein [Deltaproteobacteria bacterium]